MGHADTGGTAAIQIDRCDAAQFRHTICQFRQRHTAGDAASVHRIADHLAVGFDAQRRPGGRPLGTVQTEFRQGLPVPDQQVTAAYGIGHIFPVCVDVRGNGDGISHFQLADGLLERLIAVILRQRQDKAVCRNGTGFRFLQNFRHGAGHLAAEPQGVFFGRQHYMITGNIAPGLSIIVPGVENDTVIFCQQLIIMQQNLFPPPTSVD